MLGLDAERVGQLAAGLLPPEGEQPPVAGVQPAGRLDQLAALARDDDYSGPQANTGL